MKNFNIFKNTKKTNENQPDYTISVSEKLADGTYKNIDAGACWAKPMKDGGKFLSCQLKDARDHEGVSYPGFFIQQDNEGVPTRKEEPVQEEVESDVIPF